ncbi:hypothetical protein [Tenacibaculum jejuense]|uniref:Uncharacterized protein n=1 Tax=Tenacibaculum jejuense TaxID=584609 RepID=A0A238UF73_9FLAO|nr:hypothetical protein [Tenacibaculum jejuense]SNR17646.1 protein of unknown function [Tenacibaculum jejuense]
MKLENNEKLFKILNQIILEEHYKGMISPTSFEFQRAAKSNNIRIIGVLKEDNLFHLKHDYVFPTNYSFRIFLVCLLVAIVVFAIQSNWFPIILFFALGIGLLMSFRVKGEKQKELFLERFIETKKRLFKEDYS